MSISNHALAEAYVMRKIHQKKMKNATFNAQDTTRLNKLDNDDDRASSTMGCFPSLFRKIHPTTSSTVLVSDSSPYQHNS